jgi:hypothetical protein
MEQLNQNPLVTERLRSRLSEYRELLQKAVAGAPNSGNQHP